jgi:hypothetical protein
MESFWSRVAFVVVITVIGTGISFFTGEPTNLTVIGSIALAAYAFLLLGDWEKKRNEERERQDARDHRAARSLDEIQQQLSTIIALMERDRRG